MRIATVDSRTPSASPVVLLNRTIVLFFCIVEVRTIRRQELLSGACEGRSLAAAKARGKRLGGHREIKLSEQSQAAGRSAQADRAKQRATDLAPVLSRLSSEASRQLVQWHEH